MGWLNASKQPVQSRQCLRPTVQRLVAPRLRALSPNRLVSVLLGLVFIGAALLKSHQLLVEPSVTLTVAEQRWLAFGAVQLELALGWLLITGYFPRATWWLALSCLTALAGTSLSHAAAGETSCGCFGALTVSPWATLVFDLGALGLLLRWPPTTAEARKVFMSKRLQACGAIIIWMMAAAPLAVLLIRQDFTTLEELNSTADAKTIVVDPSRWVGERFPLLGEIRINADLSVGHWVVLFHRQGCPACQRALTRVIARATATDQGDATARMAYAVVEASSSDSLLEPTYERAVKHGQLNFRRQWLIETPTLAVLDNGVVISATSGASVSDELAWYGAAQGQWF